MVSIGVAFLGVVLLALGVASVVVPQYVFLLRNWPFASSDGGLTTSGERAYKKQGYALIVLGAFVVLLSFAM